jgi:hypothetical protein
MNDGDTSAAAPSALSDAKISGVPQRQRKHYAAKSRLSTYLQATVVR